MYTLTSTTRALALGAALFVAACSANEELVGGTQSLNFVLQDLSIDPTGRTTVLTFTEAPTGAGPEAYQADGGQTAQSVSYFGDTAQVTWNERVSPSDEVRIADQPSYLDAWVQVETSDSSATTFSIASATQVGLGADTITLSISGPRLIESELEDMANWSYSVSGYEQDLTGTTFAYHPASATVTITLGQAASLHESFTLTPSTIRTVADVEAAYDILNGTSTGDSTAPMLVTVEQNLSENAYGQVVDFTFDEGMDPFFCAPGAYYQVDGNVAMSVSQPAGNMLRVAYAAPVIPGVDTVNVSSSLMDLRGNGLANSGSFAVSQLAPFVNAFTSGCVATSYENEGGDYLVMYTDQAFEAQAAIEPSAWLFTLDGAPVALGGQELSYDFENHTLRVDLNFDMQNGAAWTMTALGILEVDGQSFSGSCNGTVSGDSESPYVFHVIQNRAYDSEGMTLDVRFSEDCSTASAEDMSNWGVSGGALVVGASLISNNRVVRLSCDAMVMPGEHTLSCSGLVDLAGNMMSAPISGVEIASTDTSAPSVMASTASAYEGAGNDEVFVVFSEDMYASDCEDVSNWTFESPQGTARDLSGASISYDAMHRTCTMSFGVDMDMNLKRGDDYALNFNGVRDLSGNTLSANSLTGTVLYETSQPRVVDCWREASGNGLVIRFSEPCDWTRDILGMTRYVLRDGAGMVLTETALTATTLDYGLGVRVYFGVAIQPDYTIDVYGITDLAGNHLFPDKGRNLSVEDGSLPGFLVGATIIDVMSGEDNDTMFLQFDRKMSPWGITDYENYTLSTGGDVFDLSAATFGFDGDRMVMVQMDHGTMDNLQDGSSYTVTVTNVQTAQGVMRGVADSDVSTASGDNAFPTALLGDVRLDPLYPSCVLIQCSEALDPTLAADASQFDLNGVPATASELVSPRCCRVTFGSIPAEFDIVGFTLMDLAGNASGVISRAVVASDITPPLLVGIEGVAVSGVGGDEIRVEFSEDIDTNTYYNPSNYMFINGGNVVSLGTASYVYDSTDYTVTISLGQGFDLDPDLGLSATVQGVMDCSGNAIPAPGVTLAGTCIGDSATPTISGAFVDYRADMNGVVIEVGFSEDVDTSWCADPMNWSTVGGAIVASVEVGGDNSCTLYLLQPLVEGQTIDLSAGLMDAAGNVADALSSAPIF